MVRWMFFFCASESVEDVRQECEEFMHVEEETHDS